MTVVATSGAPERITAAALAPARAARYPHNMRSAHSSNSTPGSDVPTKTPHPKLGTNTAAELAAPHTAHLSKRTHHSRPHTLAQLQGKDKNADDVTNAVKALSSKLGMITPFSWFTLPRCQANLFFLEVIARHDATGTPSILVAGRNTKDTITRTYQHTFGSYSHYCQKYDMSGTTIEFLYSDTKDKALATTTHTPSPGLGNGTTTTLVHCFAMASAESFNVCGQMLTNNTEHPPGVPMAHATPEQLRRLAEDFPDCDGAIDYILDVAATPENNDAVATFGKATKAATTATAPVQTAPTAPTPPVHLAPAADEHPNSGNDMYLTMKDRISDEAYAAGDAAVTAAMRAAITVGLGTMSASERAQRVLEYEPQYYPDLLEDPEASFVYTPPAVAAGAVPLTPVETAATQVSQKSAHFALVFGRHLEASRARHAELINAYDAKVLAAKLDADRFISQTAIHEAQMKIYNSTSLKQTQEAQLKSSQSTDRARRALELNQLATAKGTDRDFERDLNTLHRAMTSIIDPSTGKCAFSFYSDDGPYMTIGGNMAAVNVCLSKYVKLEIRSIDIMKALVNSGPPSLRTFVAAEMPILAKTWWVDSTMRAFQIVDVSAMMLTCVMSYLDRCRTAYSFDNIVKMHLSSVTATVVNKTLDLGPVIKGVAKLIKACKDMSIERDDPVLWTALFTAVKWDTPSKSSIMAHMTIELQGALEKAYKEHLRGRHPTDIADIVSIMRDFHTDHWKFEDEPDNGPDEVRDTTGIIAAMWGVVPDTGNSINAVNDDTSDGGQAAPKPDGDGGGPPPSKPNKSGSSRLKLHRGVCMKYLELPSACLDGDDCPNKHDVCCSDLNKQEQQHVIENFGIRDKEVAYDPVKLRKLGVYDHHLCDEAAYLSKIDHKDGVAPVDRSSYVTIEQRRKNKVTDRNRRRRRETAAAARKQKHQDTDDETGSVAASDTSGITDTASAASVSTGGSTFSSLTRDMHCHTIGNTEMDYSQVAGMIKDMAIMDGNRDVIDLLDRYEDGDETQFCMMVSAYAAKNFPSR